MDSPFRTNGRDFFSGKQEGLQSKTVTYYRYRKTYYTYIEAHFLSKYSTAKRLRRRKAWHVLGNSCRTGLQGAAEREKFIRITSGCSFACFILHGNSTFFYCLFPVKQNPEVRQMSFISKKLRNGGHLNVRMDQDQSQGFL